MASTLEILAPPGGPVVLTVLGDGLTSALAEPLREAFARSEIRTATALVIDLEGVTEVDYVTLGVLVGLCDHARVSGIDVTLVGVTEPVANLLYAGGHEDLLAIPQQPDGNDSRPSLR